MVQTELRCLNCDVLFERGRFVPSQQTVASQGSFFSWNILRITFCRTLLMLW